MKLLKMLLEEEQPTIEELQKKVQKLEDRNANEVNQHTQQLEKMKSDLHKELSTGLQREVGALEDLAKNLDDSNKELITASISNMKQLLRYYFNK
jgi:hypothetical protein